VPLGELLTFDSTPPHVNRGITYNPAFTASLRPSARRYDSADVLTKTIVIGSMQHDRRARRLR